MFIFYRLDLKIAIRYNKIMINILNKNKVNLAGFTLAETLITLAIIGVVAAITMPTLIQNHKKKVAVNQLKAAYSIFSQAINSSIFENGEISNWDTSLSDKDFAQKYILPYLKIAGTIENKKPWKVNTLHNPPDDYLFWCNNIYTYFMPNGSAFQIGHANGGLAHAIVLSVDINGEKGANLLGTDVFVFIIDPKRNKFEPHDSSSGECVRNALWSYYGGMSCAKLIMQNDWEIPKDYPFGRGR